MKLEITICDPESGEVFENVLAIMDDTLHPDDPHRGARWLVDVIERHVDTEEAE